MGDILSLVEKAQATIDEDEAEKMAAEMMKGDFTLETFLSMQGMMKKMGSMGDIMKMMGLGGMFGLSSAQQKMVAEHGDVRMKLYETAINSMTRQERKAPDLIDMSRRRRIARGSGLKDNEVGQMLNEFQQMRQMFQLMKKSGGIPGMPGMPGMPGLPGGFGAGPTGGGFGRPMLGGTMPRGGGAAPKGFSRGKKLKKRRTEGKKF
jgi:signal recognition particle subunit SRP54